MNGRIGRGEMMPVLRLKSELCRIYRAILIVALILFGHSRSARALDPNEILVIANSNQPASLSLARYYCQKRGLPPGSIVPVALGGRLHDTMSRDEYNNRLAHPIRRLLRTRKDLARIKCLVTTYGIPFRVDRRGPLRDSAARLTELRRQLQRTKAALDELDEDDPNDAVEHQKHQNEVRRIESEMDGLNGKETEASVDSELSMVLSENYELYRWQPNLLRREITHPYKTLMVCRLDGPGVEIAKGLVDKALEAEANGLHGTAYVDSRGIYSKEAYGYYDQSLRDLAMLTQLRTTLPVKEERTNELFEAGSCPDAALYCGWYSLKKYVDAFDFVPGAVGFHIASFEAAHLRTSHSEWCPAMLKDGITATLGAVEEPYLHAFPQPRLFFDELFEGRCLVEAYYRTKPFNSWQLVLIGDPLYQPFKNGQKKE